MNDMTPELIAELVKLRASWLKVMQAVEAEREAGRRWIEYQAIADDKRANMIQAVIPALPMLLQAAKDRYDLRTELDAWEAEAPLVSKFVADLMLSEHRLKRENADLQSVIDKMTKTIRHIGAMAGNPDSQAALRNIVKAAADSEGGGE